MAALTELGEPLAEADAQHLVAEVRAAGLLDGDGLVGARALVRQLATTRVL